MTRKQSWLAAFGVIVGFWVAVALFIAFVGPLIWNFFFYG